MAKQWTNVVAGRWEQVSAKLEQLGAEIPDGKFDWRPAEGLRSCAEVLRHVAFWNEYLAASLAGRKADDAANELPAAQYATKQSVLEALRKSSLEVAAALEKAPEQVLPFLEHNSEHYGQLVVYARLLGVVPPASRA